MKLTNKYGLPNTVVRALTRSEYSKGESNRSVTQIIDSPRVRILRQENWDNMEEDVSEKMWAVLGSAAHKMFEETGDDKHVTEERLFAEVEGWVISGAIDVQRIDDGGITIIDYKTTSVWSVILGKKEWEYQLNCYAYLIRRSTWKIVTSATVLAVLRDFKRNLFKKQEHGQCAVSVMNINLWPNDQQESYIKQRVALHQEVEMSHAMGEKVIHCTDLEQWRKPNSFAVMIEGKKRAKMICETETEAEFQASMVQGGYVEKRFGIPMKCQANYCGVAQQCDQKQSEKLYQILGRKDPDDQYGD